MTSPLLPLPIDAFRDANGLAVFSSVDEAVAVLAPDEPVQCLYPERLQANARAFLDGFPGRVLYAVKSNPDRRVLQYLYRAGVRHFDVASLPEIELVRGLFPHARLSFMHPVKSRRAIAAAYRYGVKDFAVDSDGEILKIIEETNAARRVNLFVRLALPKGEAALNLSEKFGAAPEEAVTLLRQARRLSAKLGLCFHVGSQCLSPEAYRTAIKLAREVIDQAGVKVDILDVGGGFPVAYPGQTPPPVDTFLAATRAAAEANGFAGTELWCEPGRAIGATAGSILVKVEMRRGDRLYINDGTYGSLFDAGALGWRFPVRLIRARGPASEMLLPFSFYGPTCDCIDVMKGPFYLPEDVQEGDWIEVANLGAYGFAMRTAFNGFYSDTTVAILPEDVASARARRSSAKPIRLHDRLAARAGRQATK
jgi:ornithine decarboxylase